MMMHGARLWVLAFALVLGIAWLVPRLRPHELPVSGAGGAPEEQDALARMDRLLFRDAIAPIYQPRFVSASQARLHADELVLGVSIRGEAKAYPITILNGREIVNDVVGGVPILATW